MAIGIWQFFGNRCGMIVLVVLRVIYSFLSA
jgi:hypothetical protein